MNENTEEKVNNTEVKTTPEVTKNETIDALEEAAAGARTEEQKEILDLMKADQKFVAIRQIMEVRNRVAQVQAVKEEAVSKIHTMCPDSRLSVVESRALLLDVNKMAALDMKKEEDWAKVKECYTFEDGGMLQFTSDPDLNDVKIREMHRDFLLYLKKVKEEEDKFEVYETKMKNDIDKLMNDFEDAVGKLEADKLRNYADFADYYRDWVSEKLKDTELSAVARAGLQRVYDADQQGITLEFLIKEIKDLIGRKGDASSLLWGYKNTYGDVARKAEAVLRTRFAKYKFHIAFTKFYDFEKRVFPTDYAKYNNLFMFIVFRYIKSNYNHFDNNSMITIGELLTQLGFLLRPEEERPAITKTFEESYRTVMSLVINH